MKKLKIDFHRLLAVFIEHPGVIAMLTYACICLTIEPLNIFDSTGADTIATFLKPLFLMPYCIIAALVADRYAGKYKLPANLAVLVLCLSAFFIPGIEGWPQHPCYLITAFCVMPLCLLTYKLDLQNERFSKSTVNIIWSAIISLAAGALTFLLLEGIMLSIKLLFDLTVKYIDIFIPCLSFLLVTPLFFLYLTDSDTEEESLAKIFRIVSEYIISPALLAYSAVLLAYGAKILFTWDLPKGGVSVMCFIWALVFFYVMMADRALGFRHLKWVRHLRWAAIPIISMLWIAAIRRIFDYGYTPGRYFLILCGLLATLYSALELMKVEKGYYAVAAAGALVFLGAVTVPGLNYKAVSLRSQIARVNKVLESKDSLTCEQVARIRSSWDIIKELDDTKLEKLNITADELQSLSQDGKIGNETRFNITRDSKRLSLEGYTQLVEISYKDIEDGVMTIDGRKFNLDDIFQKQCHDAGLVSPVTQEQIEQAKEQLLVYDGEDFRLVWSSRYIQIENDGSFTEGWKQNPDYILFK